MELKDFKVGELREVVRQVAPETRGAGGLGHVGNKDALIAFLQEKGVMPGEVNEVLNGNKDLRAPEDAGSGELFGSTVGASAAVSGGTPSDYGTGSGEGSSGEGSSGEGAGDGDGDGEADGKQQESSDGGKGSTGKDDGEQGEQSESESFPPPTGKTDDGSADELEILRQIITKNVQKPSGVDEEAVSAIVDKKLKAFRKKLTKVIELKTPEGEIKTIGLCHKMTEQIARVCNLGIHQMLVGPAGGGKTTCVEKVAEMLNLKFYPVSVGPQTTKSDLLGFIDAAGNYHTTPLRLAFENGGLLLLDEVDAANAGVLTVINSMLANGYCSFPDGIIQKHENFRCICACNTYGRGADRQYVGRNQLDAATLDRFAVVDFDYDEDLERQIAGNDEWVQTVQKLRRNAFNLKMRVVISPRASIFGARMLAAGMKPQDVAELVIWKGIDLDMRQKIMGR